MPTLDTSPVPSEPASQVVWIPVIYDSSTDVRSLPGLPCQHSYQSKPECERTCARMNELLASHLPAHPTPTQKFIPHAIVLPEPIPTPVFLPHSHMHGAITR